MSDNKWIFASTRVPGPRCQENSGNFMSIDSSTIDTALSSGVTKKEPVAGSCWLVPDATGLLALPAWLKRNSVLRSWAVRLLAPSLRAGETVCSTGIRRRAHTHGRPAICPAARPSPMGGRPDYVEQLFAKYAKEGQLKRKEYSAFVRGTEGEPEAAVDRHRWEHDCKALGRSPSDGLDLGAFRKLYEYSRGYTGPRLHIGRAQEDLRGVPPQHVRATITLDGEIDDLAGKPGSDVRKSFLLGFVQDVASVLSSVSNSPVSAAELTIMHIARPSAVVDLDIAPNSTDGVSVSPANVAAAFYDAVHLPTLRVSTKPGVKVERHDPHAQLKAIFARADRNHDGVLTRGELAARLREDAELAALLKLPDAESMSPGSSRLWARDFDRIFKQMDADESRRIDETEFIRYFSRDFFRAKLADQVADVAAPQLQARIALEPEPELSAQARGSELEPVEQSVTTTSQTGRRSKPHPPAPLPLLRWPSELSELVVVPQVAACLSEIGLGCLDDCAFLE